MEYLYGSNYVVSVMHGHSCLSLVIRDSYYPLVLVTVTGVMSVCLCSGMKPETTFPSKITKIKRQPRIENKR